MRKKNAVSEFTDQRSRLLLKNFRESLARQSKISARKAFQDAVESPAPRFWVSEARAARVISMMMAGDDPTPSMSQEKARMYREIFRRVSILRERWPEASVGDLVFRVVNQCAPSSYISVVRARQIIRSLRK